MAFYLCELPNETQKAIRNELEKVGLFKEEIDYAMTFKVYDLDEVINIREILNRK